MAWLALIVTMFHGTALDASAQEHAKVSTNCTTEVNRTDPNESNPSPRGGCAPDSRCCAGTNTDGDRVGKSPDGSKASPETATVLAIVKSTLEGVHEHTDFLATLWKWTTVVAGFCLAVLALFGYATIRDVKMVGEQANQSVTQMKTQFDELSTQMKAQFDELSTQMKAQYDQLSKEMMSNSIVMMNCSNLQRALDMIRTQRDEPGHAAQTENEFIRRETAAYEDVVSTLSEVLADNSPTDPGVAAYAYDFLGFANYKLGKMSKALEMAKKSLEFKEKNATALYNAACYAARLRLIDASLGFLERAIEQDQGRATSAKTDADFDPLRQLPKFILLLGP